MTTQNHMYAGKERLTEPSKAYQPASIRILICLLMIACISSLSATDIFINGESEEPLQTGDYYTPYHSIQNAINAVPFLVIPDSIATFQIMAGNYNENIVLEIDTLYNSDVKKWIFRAYDGQVCIIDSLGIYGIMEFMSMMGCDVYIENIEFQSPFPMSKGIFVTSPCLIGTLKVSGCSFNQLDRGIYITEGYNDDSITIIDSFLVQNCSFDGIRSGGYGILTSAAKSENYTVENKFITNINIKDNVFNTELVVNPYTGYDFNSITIRNWRKNSPAYDSVAVFNNLFINSQSNIQPAAMSIERLNAFHSSHECDRKLKIWVYDNKIENSRILSIHSKLRFYNNKAAFLNDPVHYFLSFTSFNGYQDTLWAERNYVKSYRNYSLNYAVLIDNHNTYVGEDSQSTTVCMHANYSNAYITNSILHGFSDFFLIAGSSITVQYCFIDDIENHNLVFYNEESMVTGDPLIQYDDSNMTYELIWNSNQKSPCIDAGYPEQLDVLYNRPDIGAVEFSGFVNHTYSYTFPPFSENYGIKWMSYPVLYDVVNNQFCNEIEAGDLLHPILLTDSRRLDYVDWNRIYDYYPTINRIWYDQPNWTYLDSLITSPQGYKVQMHRMNQQERVIEVSGFLQDENTIVELYGPHNNQPVENWLGYYLPQTQKFFEAFGSAIDNIYYVQSQFWTMCRVNSAPGAPWLGRISDPEYDPITLSPGDMVIIKCFRDFNFSWSDSGIDRIAYDPPKPEHYEYVEKLDYIPIYVDFKGSGLELPKEIAVFVNGECKGAAVVTDSLAQICAYICDELPANPELEFMLFYDSKQQDMMPAYRVWDNHSSSFVEGKLIPQERRDYYRVRLTSGGNAVPLPRLYLSNFPNPFNPETTINYYVPGKERIRVSIYNAKGQLVRALVDAKMSEGMQTISWRGDADNGRKCSSGLYFCKIEYQGRSISKKIMLIK